MDLLHVWQSLRVQVVVVTAVIVALVRSDCSANDRAMAGCGEMCVRFLLYSYNVPANDDVIAKELSVGEHGETSLDHLQGALARHGLAFRAVVVREKNLLSQGPFPLILFLQPSEATPIGHFVCAIKGTSNDSVVIIDAFGSPQSGEVAVEQVSKHWTGLALIPVESAVATTSSDYEGVVAWLLLAGSLCILFALLVRTRTLRNLPSRSKCLFPVQSFFVAVVSCWMLCEPARIAWCEEVIEMPVKKLGIVMAEASEVTGSFSWTNRTGKSLTISKIGASCTCSDVRPSKNVVPPGERVEFQAVVDVRDKWGTVNGSFSVNFEEPSSPRLEYFYSYVHNRAITVEPSSADFGDVSRDETVRRKFRIVSVKSNYHQLDVKVGDSRLPDGVALIAEKPRTWKLDGPEAAGVSFCQVYDLTIDPRRMPDGEFRGEIPLHVRTELGVERHVVRYSGAVMPDVTLRPRKVLATVTAEDYVETVRLHFSKNVLGAVTDIRCSCEDDSVTASVIESIDNLKRERDVVVTAHLGNRSIVASVIAITMKIGGEVVECRLPVKIIRIGRSSN